jgi:TolB-like protein/Flp pilus assembly protein TadD
MAGESPHKAVFLSYASQDAEAAKRICDALRAAGLEVWFDADGGLEHGDEWDAKIRRQIKECVLFIAVISANTQAREEGYFRIEWELAAQRALGIASGVAFILPVVIDDTREPAALVPDRFRTVQWTRLPGGAIPPDVLQRFLKLWSHRTGALRHAEVGASLADARGRAQGAPLHVRPSAALRYGLVALGLVVLTAAYLIFKPRRSAEESGKIVADAPHLAAAVTPPAAVLPAVSEARQLVAKAYALIRGLEATREDFTLAEEYCQHAMKLDPDDGEVWAAYAQLNSAFGYRGWDTSSARREQTRFMAERAIRLAPQSAEARMAQASAWSTFGINRDEREKLLREIVRDAPDNQGALRFLAVTVLAKPNGLEECLAINERSAALPGGDPLALFNNARYLWTNGQPAKGYEVLQRALAQRTFTSGLVLKVAMEITWRGDLAAAEATLRQIPQSALQEDRANYNAGLLRYTQGNAAAALEAWQSFPRDYYVDFVYEGPKGLLLGLADELDHRDAAAKVEWRAALQLVEKKIAAAPSKPAPYYSQAYLLACLGEKAAANDALRTYEQLASIKYTPEQPMTIPLAKIYVRLGRFDEIFAHPPGGSRTILRISPDFETLRADPRFKSLLEPAAKTEDRGQQPDAGVPVDEKSVAVLAFANLSDDKANEYFSDGISEELLNVLAKVPGLKVTARTSSFHFKGKDTSIPEIAKQLGVAFVVEGSVRKQGDKVRITAQLIKAEGGFHVWSDTFTRDLKDIFAVQDEIAGLIAQNLRAKMAMTRERSAPALEVYALILQARHANAHETNDGAREAIALYQQALARDPKSADAWAELALNYVQLGRFGGLPTAEAMREARIAARRALDLEAEHPLGLLALAWVQRTDDRDWRGAITSFRRALAAAPGNVTIMSDASICFLNVGYIGEAEALATQAIARDPLNARAQWSLGAIYLWSGRPVLAIDAYRRASVLAPTADEYHSHLSRALAMSGRFPEALAEARLEPNERYRLVALAAIQYYSGDQAGGDRTLQEIVAKYGDSMCGYLANLSAAAGRTDEVFHWLERGYQTRDAAMAWIKTNAAYRAVTSDPRWEQFLRKMGLADDQLK